MPRTTKFTFALILALATPATAQMSPEDEQRCVWQCLHNFPGAASKQYSDCVARMCTPAATPPASAAPPKAVWRAGGGNAGEHFAGVEIPNAAFGFVCRQNGSATFAIGGIGGTGQAVEIRVDQQPYGLDFTVKGTTLLAEVPARSHIVRALMGGSILQVADQSTRRSITFPLTGSSSAIRTALAGCGIRF